MFLGTYRHQIDQKNRIRIPSKFKQGLGNNFVITKGIGGCLFVLPDGGDKLFEKIAELPTFDEDVQKSVRILLSSAFEADEDAQGRLLLPKELINFANIKKNIVFVGVGKRVEIWAEEHWEEYNTNSDFDTITQSFKKHGV